MLTNADPIVFYALLRMDTLVHTAPVPFQPMRIAIGTADDPKALLQLAATVDPKRIAADVEAAIKKAIVPDSARKSLPQVLEALKGVKPDPQGGDGSRPDKVLELAGQLMEPGRLRRFQDLIAKGQSDLPGLLEELTTGKILDLAGGAKPAANGVSATLRPQGLSMQALAGGRGPARRGTRGGTRALPPQALAQALRKAAPKLSERALKIQQRRIERKLSATRPTEVFRSASRRGRHARERPQARRSPPQKTP